MSEIPPHPTDQQLRRYFARQHPAEPTPAQTWRDVAARLAAPTERGSSMNDISQSENGADMQTSPVSRGERARLRRAATPPRRGALTGVVGLAAVVVLALFARALFARGPGAGAASLTESTLASVSMTSATEGWAVGFATTKTQAQLDARRTPAIVPLLFHFTGSTWRAVPPPAGLAGAELATVGMSNAGEGWAGGGYNEDPPRYGGPVDSPTDKSAVLLHYDGTAWQSVTVPQALLNMQIAQIVYDRSGDAWALATSANYDGRVAILHEHGGVWAVADTRSLGGYIQGGSIDMLNGGWATITHAPDATTGPITSTLLHLQGTVWSVAPSPPGVTLQSVAMTSQTEGWAIGDEAHMPVLYHYARGMWTPVTAGLSADDATYATLTFTSTAPSQGWLAFGRRDSANPGPYNYGLYHYDGATWKDAHIALPATITAASFTSATDGWFVGSGREASGTLVANNGEYISYPAVFVHLHNGVATMTSAGS